ncbi:hypothetical protein ACIRFH_05955 [Streptomyces sp. NPDC093586]|uniref:hypothetical protein n=1 Tax=Streptomyces sp. NPDC093586 TaxID=3366042 RepID=UPI0037FC0891
MVGPRARRTVAVTVLAAAAPTGCSDDGDGDGDGVAPTGPASAAAGRAASAASSLASEDADTLASATAEAGRWVEDITAGTDVEGDVRAGRRRPTPTGAPRPGSPSTTPRTRRSPSRCR